MMTEKCCWRSWLWKCLMLERAARPSHLRTKYSTMNMIMMMNMFMMMNMIMMMHRIMMMNMFDVWSARLGHSLPAGPCESFVCGPPNHKLRTTNPVTTQPYPAQTQTNPVTTQPNPKTNPKTTNRLTKNTVSTVFQHGITTKTRIPTKTKDRL